MRPIRSLLFAPANRPELLQKFPRYPADAFVIDLEDGTPEAEKDSARRALPQIVASLRSQGLKGQIYVRTNAPRSKHVQADLSATNEMPIDGIVVPKIESIEDLNGFKSAAQIIGIIETGRGVVNVETIAQGANPYLVALAFGAEDFITDIGGQRSTDGLEVLYARSRVVLAARVAGIQALDQVFVNIRDDETFLHDAELGRYLGYSGKMCIVPRQIEIANAVFSPSADEIDRSQRLIDEYERAKAQGRGAIEFEGSMVDEPLLKRARAILQLAADIGNR
jgi:citrate lyase subunit beta / citryl-CoA lyase